MAMVDGKLQLRISYFFPACPSCMAANSYIFSFDNSSLKAKKAFEDSVSYYNNKSKMNVKLQERRYNRGQKITVPDDIRSKKGARIIEPNLRATAFSPLYDPVKKAKITIPRKIKLESNNTLKDVLTECGIDEDFPMDKVAFRVYFE